jgi:FlaA1/EpsC-like NDP-sugar epimerase
LTLEPLGYVDDDPKKIGNTFHGLKVLGATSDIPRICAEYRIDEAVIAIPSAPGRKIREIVEACITAGIRYKTLPGYGDLINGQVSFDLIREVDLEDLLGRNPVTLDVDGIRQYLTNRTVLVTGAAGSIGSELCRQIARFAPQRIVLLDMAETPLFFIEREFVANFPQIRIAAVIGDVRDSAQMTAVFEEFAPKTVFHAAAYKHVPLMEANSCSAVLNNIQGTLNVAETADRCGVDTFVLISTDKAVNPANIMGASKRIAEMTVQSLAQSSRTHFVTVRFGNVLGSNGSVVPIFKEQIRRGGPVTVTHPEVTRFFMTIHEAAQLVLQAGSMGKGGEIYVLDMGEPVRIVHMAEELIRLSGLRPYEDIDITFTGLRPGEKLYEELMLATEGTQATRHQKIWIARAQAPDAAALHDDLEVLFAMAKTLDRRGVVRQMKKIVPEFAADVTQ